MSRHERGVEVRERRLGHNMLVAGWALQAVAFAGTPVVGC